MNKLWTCAVVLKWLGSGSRVLKFGQCRKRDILLMLALLFSFRFVLNNALFYATGYFQERPDRLFLVAPCGISVKGFCDAIVWRGGLIAVSPDLVLFYFFVPSVFIITAKSELNNID